MGLMISSIAKVENNILPKNIFKTNLDFYLYILEYSDFDIQEAHNYSSELHSSGMSRILNNYQYSFKNIGFKKLKSLTFHSEKVINYQAIFDIKNLSFEETKPATITPAFLFTTLLPEEIDNISINNVSDNEFIFLKIKPKDRDANRVPQLVNEIFSRTGLAISKCLRSDITSKYKSVYIYDYCDTVAQAIKQEIIMGDKYEIGKISNSNGQITVGKENKTTVNANDELGNKSYNWQKWGVITGTVIGIVAIIATILYS